MATVEIEIRDAETGEVIEQPDDDEESDRE